MQRSEGDSDFHSVLKAKSPLGKMVCDPVVQLMPLSLETVGAMTPSMAE